MANDIDIRIGATDLASSVINKIAGSMGSAGLAGAVGVAVGGFTTMVGVMRESIKTYVNYADEVRNLSRLTGQSAEETSRMIQLADDMKVSYGELTTALRYAVRQGVDPSIESIAKMSDEYLKLQPGLERSAFLMEHFGRQGTVMAELMEQGSGAIREMNGAIDANLILNRKAVDEARAYERAIDELNDTFEGLKIELGQELVPALVDLLVQVDKSIDGWQELAKWIDYTKLHARDYVTFVGDWKYGNQEVADSYEDIMRAQRGVTWEFAAATEAMEVSADSFNAIIGYAVSYQNISENINELEAERAEAIEQGYKAWGSKIQGIDADIAELRRQQQLLANQVILDFYKIKLAADGFTDADVRAYFDMAVALGLMEQAAVDVAIALAEDQGILEKMPATVDTTVTITTIHKDIYLTQYGEYSMTPRPGGGTTPVMTAGGGPSINPGGTLVGERGWEYIDPGGYVHSHAESVAMMNVGAINVTGGLQGGGRLSSPAVSAASAFPVQELASAIASEIVRILG